MTDEPDSDIVEAIKIAVGGFMLCVALAWMVFLPTVGLLYVLGRLP